MTLRVCVVCVLAGGGEYLIVRIIASTAGDGGANILHCLCKHGRLSSLTIDTIFYPRIIVIYM